MSAMGDKAIQTYNGGIIFVSYLISVIGAQTTLELLTRRTHIRGYYNWFLLSAASFTMGGVGIWSMHFVGNNSMTLLVQNTSYQLFYHGGYTFASLTVAIACMFLAFTFVGISEEAKVSRIIPSGVFAGLGIVCMHYLGQFAIDHFVLVYRPAYIIGAAIIACVAATTALFIFFKLRERWMNLWYKRLGCALLMGLGVCGMHYTALVGTDFYRPNYHETIPIPKLQTPALIGIISGVILSACIALLYIGIKAGMKNLPKYIKNTNKRLILDAVIFDPLGRILVKVDGTLPMTELVHNLEHNESKLPFSTSHPLFIRLFESSILRASLRYSGEKRPSGTSGNSSIEAYEAIVAQFKDGCRELTEELRFEDYSDLGILSDIVVTTNTIAKANAVFNKSTQMFRNSSCSSWSKKVVMNGIQRTQTDDEDEDASRQSTNGFSIKKSKEDKPKKTTRWYHNKKRSFGDDEETAIGSIATNKRSSGGTTIGIANHNDYRSSSDETRQEDRQSVNNRLSVEDSDGEDKHIFLVRKLVYENDVSRLLSQGYRFAEPVFIAKTMGEKLRIPTDHMRHHFADMQQMTDSLCALTQLDWLPSTEAPAPNPTEFKASTKGSVQVGVFVLIDESKDLSNIQILIDKTKRYAFPTVQLTLDKQIETPITLEPQEVDFIRNLQGLSLFDIANLSQTMASHLKDGSLKSLPSESFVRGLESAARQLVDSTSYSKALYQKSALHPVILDLPPFSLTTGPCQLILFKSFVRTPGAIAAVNYTFAEPMKSVPLDIYRSLCGFITDQAASIYQICVQLQSTPIYLFQQQMYRQQTNYDNKRAVYSSGGEDDMSIQMSTFNDGPDLSLSDPGTSNPSLVDPFSLPPPPRAKRNRFKLSNSLLSSPSDIFSLPSNDITSPPSPGRKTLHLLQNAPLSILSTQDRFWWINSITEETIHNDVLV